jgi:hypothetical protein
MNQAAQILFYLTTYTFFGNCILTGLHTTGNAIPPQRN